MKLNTPLNCIKIECTTNSLGDLKFSSALSVCDAVQAIKKKTKSRNKCCYCCCCYYNTTHIQYTWYHGLRTNRISNTQKPKRFRTHSISNPNSILKLHCICVSWAGDCTSNISHIHKNHRAICVTCIEHTPMERRNWEIVVNHCDEHLQRLKCSPCIKIYKRLDHFNTSTNKYAFTKANG